MAVSRLISEILNVEYVTLKSGSDVTQPFDRLGMVSY